MQPLWATLSQLGDSRWLLPLGLVLILFGPKESRALRIRWGAGLAISGGLTLASKLAFLGWGIGWARLDFTGFSGHATLTAAVYPVTVYLAAYGRLPQPLLWALLGSLLAAMVAYSRLPLNAHSSSEVISGWLLGTAATVFALSGRSIGWTTPLPTLAASVVVGLALPMLTPAVRTHDLVIGLATELSGRDQVFNRHCFVR